MNDSCDQRINSLDADDGRLSLAPFGHSMDYLKRLTA